MRKLYHLLFALFIMASAIAQSPKKVSYQAIIRNAEGALVINKDISITVSIVQDSDLGTEVYRETHTTKTNANALVSLEIGSGEVEVGLFSSIDWKNGSYFIKSQTIIEGQTITSTREILSVPYALHTNNASTVHGKTIVTEVPEGALFRDAQSAKDVQIDKITSLSATHVQEALEELQESMVTGGEMKKTTYDANKDNLTDNASSLKGLTVETPVPEEALFTDTQTGSEVDLATAIDIDGDSTNETTVEAALIKLNELVKTLRDEHASRRILSLETREENRPCLATHYDETYDVLSFITGTERILDNTTEHYCHYIYGQESFVANSYKVIEEGLMEKTEAPDQALRTSFIANPSETKSINFTQPLLCRHPGTENWGSVETWEGNKLCVFGLYFPKDDGTYVLDRGASEQYELYTYLPLSYPGGQPHLKYGHHYKLYHAREDYRCAQVKQSELNAKEIDHIFLEGHYNSKDGTCRIISQDNSVEELRNDFFVYYSPVNNFIFNELGAIVFSRSDRQNLRLSTEEDKIALKEYLWEQALYVNVNNNTYESVSYEHNYDYLCNDDDKVCEGSMDDILEGNSPDQFVLLQAYDLDANTEFELNNYLGEIKKEYNNDLLIKSYLYELQENEKIGTNIKFYVAKRLIEHHSNLWSNHPELNFPASEQDDSNIDGQKVDLRRVLTSSNNHLWYLPTIYTVMRIYDWLIKDYSRENGLTPERLAADLSSLEELSEGNSLAEHIRFNRTSNTYFDTDFNEVHDFIRETLDNNHNAFPSYFAYNHPELILTGSQLEPEQRISIMMADFSSQCPDILKDWDSNAIDLTKPERISKCMLQEEENHNGNIGVDQGGQNNGGDDENNNGDQGGDVNDQNNNNNQQNNNNNNPNQNLEELAQDININLDHLRRFLNYILIISHELHVDFQQFTDMLMSGLNLPLEGNARVGFGNNHLTLSELQDVLRGLVNLNQDQREAMSVAIAAASINGDLERDDVTEQQTRDFLNMLNQDLPQNLTIQVLEGVQQPDNGGNVRIDEFHVYGLGSVPHVDPIAQNRVFVSGNDNEGIMLFPQDHAIRFIRGQWGGNGMLINEDYTVIYQNDNQDYVGHLDNVYHPAGQDHENNNPQNLEELAQQVQELGINTEHLNNFVTYILRVNLGDLSDDIPTLWRLIITGIDLANRIAFPESITLEQLQALLIAFRALNQNQEGINTVSNYLSQQNFAELNPDWAVAQQQATDFITLLANNHEFDNLTIQVFAGHQNIGFEHQALLGHFFGLGNADIEGLDFERIGPQRVFVSYGNNNEGLMFFTQSYLRSIRGSFNNGLVDDQQQYIITYEDGDVYIGHLNNYDPSPQVGDHYFRNAVEYAYGQINDLQNVLPGVPEGTTLSAFHDDNNVPLDDSPGAVLTLAGQEGYRGIWFQDEDHDLGTFTGIDEQYGRLTYENGDVYIGHFEEEVINPQAGDTWVHGGVEYAYGQINNLQNFLPGVPEGTTLSAFHDNNVLLDASPGAVLTMPQEGQEDDVYEGTWIQGQENFGGGMGTFTGIDCDNIGDLVVENNDDPLHYGSLTYEDGDREGDIYIGHFVNYNIRPNPGNRYITHEGINYSFRTTHYFGHNWVIHAMLSVNNNEPLNNFYAELLPGGDGNPRYEGVWVMNHQIHEFEGDVTFIGIDQQYGRLTVGDVNYEGRWIQEEEDYEDTGGTFFGINREYGRLTVGDVNYEGRWIQEEENYEGTGGIFTGIEEQYGRLTVGDVNYVGRWIQEAVNYRGTGGIFTGIEEQYGRLTVEVNGVQQPFTGTWIQEAVNYRDTGGTFTGIDEQYGMLTYENGDVYIGHFEEEVINPQAGDTWIHGGVEYAYGEINNLQNVLPGVPEGTTLSVFHSHDVLLDDSPLAVLTIGGTEYIGTWIQDRNDYGGLGTFTGIDEQYGMLTYENGNVYIGHFYEDMNPLPDHGDRFTTNEDEYIFGQTFYNEDWVLSAMLSENNNEPLNNFYAVLLPGGDGNPHYVGTWVMNHQIEGDGTFTGIDEVYGRLTVDGNSYVGTWAEIQEQLQQAGN